MLFQYFSELRIQYTPPLVSYIDNRYIYTFIRVLGMPRRHDQVCGALQTEDIKKYLIFNLTTDDASRIECVVDGI